MQQARQQIREALTEAQSPALLCSFGKDSMLLLWLVREVLPTIPVLWFRSGVTNEAFGRRMIRELNLTVYSYYPADVYLLANNGDRALVQEFSFGEDRLPMLTDLAAGDKCSLQAFPNRTAQLFLPFDLLLTGYKDSDTHWVKGGAQLFGTDLQLGKAKVRAPIRHMTDEQVRAAIYDMAIPYRAIDDTLPMCTRCMTEDSEQVWCPEEGKLIAREQWNRSEALDAFRQRFNLEEK